MLKFDEDNLLFDIIEEWVYWKFHDAEEICSSDISCCVRDILREYYENPEDATEQEFQLVRNYVHTCINELADHYDDIGNDYQPDEAQEWADFDPDC